MTKNRLYSIVLLVVLAICALVACAPEETAGGYSEETNTLAGILVNEKGEPQANVRVFARHTKANISDLVDTTDSEGKFEMQLVRQGIYGLSATKGKKAMYKMVGFYGQNVKVDAKLVSTTDVSGEIFLREDTVATDVNVAIPGSPWDTRASSKGKFSFQKVPEGIYPVVAKSPDPIRFKDAFYVAEFNDGKASFKGPYPTDLMDVVMAKATSDTLLVDSLEENDTTDIVLASASDDTTLMFPVSPDYSLLCRWPMDYLAENKEIAGTKVTSDARGRADDIFFFSDSVELTDGVSVNAVELNGAEEFGVVESDGGALDNATAITLESWVSIEKWPKDKAYRMNIIGKLGFGQNTDTEQSVFSLSLIKGECGAEKPSLAFFVAGGDMGDTLGCESVVMSSDIVTDEWMYVTAVWDAGNLALYVNGQLLETAKTSVKLINPSAEPIIFGKENLNLKLDDVRLSNKAVNYVDVLYRYYLKGGAL